MRVLITGSRTWRDVSKVYEVLNKYLRQARNDGTQMTVVHGDAAGADAIARMWCRATMRGEVKEERHPFVRGVGKAGGPIRNQQMVNLGADVVLAFIKDNSPGASGTVRLARESGLHVVEFHESTEVEVTEETEQTEVTVPNPRTRLVDRLVAVKKDIGAVGKGDRNSQQGFNFRGIDAVLNAVAGPLMKHGVMVYPCVVSAEKGTATTSKGSVMNTYLVTVDYTFTDGSDFLTTRVVGEAFDSGDKGATKAMSVAYRTALIQALSLPTDEPDPDLDSYEATPITQMSDAALFAEIEARTEVDKVKELWGEQNIGNRSAELQNAIKSRVATLQGQVSA